LFSFVHALNVFALLRDDLHFERREPTGSFQRHSDVEEDAVHKSTPVPKMDATVRPLQRAEVTM
jgi:hypothetical protein